MPCWKKTLSEVCSYDIPASLDTFYLQIGQFFEETYVFEDHQEFGIGDIFFKIVDFSIFKYSVWSHCDSKNWP